jgi:hypothetical protein
VGYATALWLSFGAAIATVAGPLTGLLFAVSVKSSVLAASRSLSSRAPGDTPPADPIAGQCRQPRIVLRGEQLSGLLN